MQILYTVMMVLAGIVALVLVIALFNLIAWIFSPHTTTVADLARRKVSSLAAELEKKAASSEAKQRERCANILKALEEIVQKDTVPARRSEAALALARALKYTDLVSNEQLSTLAQATQAAADPQFGREVVSHLRFALVERGKPTPEQQAHNDLACRLLQVHLPAQPVDEQVRKISEILAQAQGETTKRQVQSLLERIGPAALPALEQILSRQSAGGQELVLTAALYRLAAWNKRGELAARALTALQNAPVIPGSLPQVIACAQQIAPEIASPQQREIFERIVQTVLVPADGAAGVEILNAAPVVFTPGGTVTVDQKGENDFACRVMQAYLPGQPLDEQVRRVSEILRAGKEANAAGPAQDVLVKIGVAAAPAVEELIRSAGTIENTLALIPVLVRIADQCDRAELAAPAFKAIQNFPLHPAYIPQITTCARQMAAQIKNSAVREGLCNALLPWWKLEPKQITNTAPILTQLNWQPADLEDRVLLSLAIDDWQSIYALGTDAVEPLLHYREYPNRAIVSMVKHSLANIHINFLRCPSCRAIFDMKDAVRGKAYEYLTEEQSYYREAEEYTTYCCPKCSVELRSLDDERFFQS